MSLAGQPYSFSFTAGALLATESLKVTESFLRLKDWIATQNVVMGDNVLMKKTSAASIRFYREIEPRLKALTPEELGYLADATSQEQRQLLFVAVCKVYSFIYDFVVEVVRPKVLLFDHQLRNSDYEKFLSAKELSHPEIAALTDKSRAKVRQVLFRILADAGLLNSTTDLQIMPAIGANKWGLRALDPTSEELRGVAKEFRGHALALTLLARFVAVLHDGDIRKRKLIPRLEKLPEQPGGQASRILQFYERMLRGKPEIGILRLLGLFDRPVDGESLRALMRKPGVKGVTDKLDVLGSARWKFGVESLRSFRLIDPQSREQPELLDCHPLVREHFGHRLKEDNERGWKECHARLYDHFRKWPGDSPPETWEQIEPLYRAVEHACKAGQHQNAFDEVYEPLIVQKDEKNNDRYYSVKVLKAFSSDLTAICGFFSGPDDSIILPPSSNVIRPASSATSKLGISNSPL
jgi:hypothetical protein